MQGVGGAGASAGRLELRRLSELWRHHGAGCTARDDPPFTGQGRIGRLDGATRCAKLRREAASRRQALARPHAAGGDG